MPICTAMRSPSTLAATFVEGALDVDGAAQGAGHAAEGHHEAVALDADLAAAVAGDGVAHDAVVLAQDSREAWSPEPLGHAGVVDHVAEEDRDGAIGRAEALIARWPVRLPMQLASDVLAQRRQVGGIWHCVSRTELVCGSSAELLAASGSAGS